MPGLITKRRKRRWRASIMVKGIQYQKLFPDSTKQSYRQAVKWEIEKKKKIESNQTATDCLTIFNWAEEYLDYSRERFVIKTYKEKRYAFQRLLRVFPPETLLGNLTPADFLKFLRQEAGLRSGNAANKDRKNLAAAWGWGRKYMTGFPQNANNPIRAVDKFPAEKSPRYVPPEDDFWKVYEIATGQDKVLLLTLLHLAARRGEVFGLRWSDIDFPNNKVRLWTRKRRGGDREPDWLPMTSDLKVALLKWWEQRPVKNSPYVFVCIDKIPCLDERYGKPFVVRSKFMRRICKKAGVKPFSFHGIRHLTATILYHKGYDISLIQGVLRHKNPTTTNRYLRSLGLEHVRKGLEEGLKRPAKIINLSERKKAKDKS